MPVVQFVVQEALSKLDRFASGLLGPVTKRPVEIDIEHHAAEIEQQGVGVAGRKQWLVHRRCMSIGSATKTRGMPRRR